MKLKQLALAVAAFASLSGGAQAAIESNGGNDGTLYLYAFDPVARDYYVRDLGFLMNSFLPGAPFKPADATPFTDVATDAGANLNAGNTTNFADATFSTWLNSRSGILWAVGAVDNVTAGSGTSATNTSRMITSSSGEIASGSRTNGAVTNYIGSGRAGQFDGLAPNGLSQTGPGTASSDFDSNFLLGSNTLTSLGSSAGLFLMERTQPSLLNSTNAVFTQYANSQFNAVVSLASNGDFSYTLQEVSAIPLPASVWMMGAGLAAVGGFIRRRRSTAAA